MLPIVIGISGSMPPLEKGRELGAIEGLDKAVLCWEFLNFWIGVGVKADHERTQERRCSSRYRQERNRARDCTQNVIDSETLPALEPGFVLGRTSPAPLLVSIFSSVSASARGTGDNAELRPSGGRRW